MCQRSEAFGPLNPLVLIDFGENGDRMNDAPDEGSVVRQTLKLNVVGDDDDDGGEDGRLNMFNGLLELLEVLGNMDLKSLKLVSLTLGKLLPKIPVEVDG